MKYKIQHKTFNMNWNWGSGYIFFHLIRNISSREKCGAGCACGRGRHGGHPSKKKRKRGWSSVLTHFWETTLRKKSRVLSHFKKSEKFGGWQDNCELIPKADSFWTFLVEVACGSRVVSGIAILKSITLETLV